MFVFEKFFMLKKQYFLQFLLFLLTIPAFAQRPGAYSAMDLDGINDYVLITDNAGLNPSSKITVEAWIKADTFGKTSFTNSIFCKHGWATGNKGYVLRCGDNGKVSFNISNSSGTWMEAITNSILKTRQWYHVAGVFTGDSINVYVNGNLEATTLYSGTMSPSNGLSPRIGDLAYGGGRLFDGQIDEVRVWGNALSKGTIRNWMCRKVSKSHPNYSDLGGYWKLDEYGGSDAYDVSGNSNNGTLVNGPVWVLSGAALGDSSTHIYGTNALSLKTKYGDVFNVKNIKGAPASLHAFVIYDTTEQSRGNNVGGAMDTTHYFGIYYDNNSSVKFDINYDYKNLAKVQGGSKKCGVDMLVKTSGYQGTWGYTPSYLYSSGDSLAIRNQVKNEYIMNLYQTDSNFIISTPTGKPWFCGSDSVLLSASGSDSFTYVWFKDGKTLTGKNKRTLWVSTTGAYKVQATRNSTSCSFNSTTMNISNRKKPTVSLSPFSGVCENIDTVKLSGGSPTGGVFSGTGVSGGKYFLPSKTKAGKYNVSYTYTDTSVCSSTASQILEVYALPRFTRSSPLEYCSHNDSVKLTLLSPTGGLYTGKFISNGFLHLDKASHAPGFYKFKYEFTDANKCYNSMIDSFKVKQSTSCFLDPLSNFCLQDAQVTLNGFPTPGTFSGNGVTGDKFDPAKAGSGTHAIVYSYTNSNNCTTTDTQLVNVFKNTTVSWSYNLKTCQNADSVKLTQGTPSGGFFTGTQVNTNSGYFHPKKAGAGNHVLYYNYKDGNGCTNKVSSTVTLLDTSKLTLTPLAPICPSVTSYILTQVSPSGGVYSGNGVNSNIFYPKLAGKGTHKITYQYTNANVCVSKSEFDAVITKTDSISVSLPATACSYSEPIAVKVYPFGGFLKGKGVLAGSFYPAFVSSGSYWVSYTFTDSHSCNVSDSAQIYVAEAPDAGIGSFASVCDYEKPITLSGGTPADSGLYYIGGQVKTEFDPAVGKGVYNIEYKVVNHFGCRDSAVSTIRVNESPVKPTISTLKNTLSSSAVKGNQWYNASGAISGATQQQFNPVVDGYYKVRVTNDSGCYKMSDSVMFAKVGIQKLAKLGVSIYPNPSANGSFNIKGLRNGSEITIYDIHGKLLMKEVVYLDQFIINISEFGFGTYIIQVQNELGRESERLMYVK